MMERCIAEAISRIDVGLPIKKELDALMMPIDGCMMERCPLFVINDIDVGTSIEKELDALMMAIT